MHWCKQVLRDASHSVINYVPRLTLNWQTSEGVTFPNKRTAFSLVRNARICRARRSISLFDWQSHSAAKVNRSYRYLLTLGVEFRPLPKHNIDRMFAYRILLYNLTANNDLPIQITDRKLCAFLLLAMERQRDSRIDGFQKRNPWESPWQWNHKSKSKLSFASWPFLAKERKFQRRVVIGCQKWNYVDQIPTRNSESPWLTSKAADQSKHTASRPQDVCAEVHDRFVQQLGK